MFSGNNELINYHGQVSGITDEGYARILKIDYKEQLKTGASDIANRNALVTTFGQVITS